MVGWRPHCPHIVRSMKCGMPHFLHKLYLEASLPVSQIVACWIRGATEYTLFGLARSHKSSLSGSGPFESPALWGSGDWPNLRIKWQDSLAEMVAMAWRNRDMPDWRITLSFHAHRRTCEDFFPVIFFASICQWHASITRWFSADVPRKWSVGIAQSTPISV